MKLFIDISATLRQRFISGIQRTVYEFTTGLLQEKKYEVVLFSEIEDLTFQRVSNKQLLNFYKGNSNRKDLCITSERFDITRFQKGDIYLELDATWGNNLKRTVFFRELKNRGVKIVSYIYDIIAITEPQFMFPELVREFVPYAVAHFCYSDLIISSTKFTIDQIKEVCDRYKIPECEYGVVPLGVNFREESGGTIRKDVRKLVSLGKKYILLVSTIEPRKNHRLVFEAFKNGLEDLGISIVFAGRKGWRVDELLKELHEHPQYQRKIYHFEGLNDASMHYLYQHAFLVTFPSFIEGFGMPAIEGIMHGVPSIQSDTPVMHEVLGQHGDYVDPKDPDDLVEHVKKYLKPAYYQQKKEALKQFKPESWLDATKMLCEYLEDIDHKEMKQPREVRKGEVYTAQISNAAFEEACYANVPGMDELGINAELLYLSNNRISYYRELSSYRASIRKPVFFLKRLIRKLLKFLIVPIVDEINEYHMHIANFVWHQTERNHMMEYLNSKISRLENKCVELERRMEALSTEDGKKS